jgi:hypothetical protein
MRFSGKLENANLEAKWRSACEKSIHAVFLDWTARREMPTALASL